MHTLSEVTTKLEKTEKNINVRKPQDYELFKRVASFTLK